jgi:hypothetical protein
MHSPGGVPQVCEAPKLSQEHAYLVRAARQPTAAALFTYLCASTCAAALPRPPLPPFKCVCVCLPRRDFRGPLTSLTTLKGLLLLATGNRIETCTLSSTSTISPEEGSTTTTYQLQRSGEARGLSPLF